MQQTYNRSTLFFFRRCFDFTLEFLIFISLYLFLCSSSFAANKTFTGPGNFSDPSKWDLGILPSLGDNLQINGACTYDNAALNLAYGTLKIGNTLAGSIIYPVGSTNTLSVTNVLASFAGSSLNMTNGGTLVVRGTWVTTNCAYTPGTGTVEVQSTLTLPVAYTTFNNLVLNPGALGTVTLGVSTTVNNNLTITTGTLTVGAFTLNVTNIVTIFGTMNITSSTGTKTFGFLVMNGGTLSATANETVTVNNTFTSTGTSSIGALTIAVTGSATVSTGTLNLSSTTGTKTFGSLILNGTLTNTANEAININGDMVNNGTFSIGTGMVTFTGATSNSISGSAVTTAFGGGITINKGTTGTVSDTANVLDVQSLITMLDGGLTLTRGTFEISSASTLVPFVLAGTPTVIPTPAKLWCRGGTLNSTASFDWGIQGIIQLDMGAINVGTAIDDRIAPDPLGTAIIRINGGAMNIAGRISFNTNGWAYAMTGGVLTVGVVGNSSPADKDPFNMDNAICSFSMTGGRIIIERAGGSGATSNLGYHNVGTSGVGFLGGTLQIGDASTPAGTLGTMHIETNRPIYNLEVVNSNTVAQFWSYNTTISNNILITNGVLDQGTNARDITVGGNWTNNSSAAALVAGSRKVTFNGTSSQNFGGAFSTTFYDAEVNNTTSPQTSATVTLSKPMYASHSLTMTNGYLNTDATNILWLLNNSTTNVGSANSFVNGPMNYDMAVSGTSRTLTFPIGKGIDWRPAVLTAKNSVATTITFNGEVFDADAAALGWTYPATVDTVSQVHYWDIKRFTSYPSTESSTSVSGNQTIQLYFGTNDFVKDGSKLTICKNVNGGAAWVDIGGAGAPAYAAGANLTGTVTSTSAPTAFTSFSRFTLGSLLTGWNPLPIELLSFNATPCQSHVCLDWATATETNNDYFIIEKTRDGNTFEFVAKVNGAGNSNTVKDYSAIDNSPYSGVSYYRLKQTDFNGDYKYSDLRKVNFDNSVPSIFTLNVYPNPGAGNAINFAINTDKGKEVLVVVYDVTGREAYSKILITEQTGENIFALDPSGRLSQGMYLITATSDNNIFSKKLIIK